MVCVFIKLKIKPGGLNSREQLRSRFLNVSRVVLENVQIFFDCQDRLLVRLRLFRLRLGIVEILIEIVDIIKTNQDYQH